MAVYSDGPRESCGVFGVFAPGEDVARLTFYGLYALQHRGQESAGIATGDGHQIHLRAGMGLIAQVFDEADLSYLPGHVAAGHTRYSTTGSNRVENAQPLYAEGPRGPLALGHNGNLVNAAVLRHDLEQQGHLFKTSTDTEIIAELLATAPGTTWERRMGHVMQRIRGAYCIVGVTPQGVFAMRDPYGIRPLCLGSFNHGWVVASESCALDHLGATFIREVEPGEALYIDENGVSSYKPVRRQRGGLCIFEYIYFSRPDTILRGKLLYPARMAMGAQLAREHPVEADLVIGVPDSATAAATGYARESGIPYVEGLVKNRYVGRTFIQPDQRLREMGVYLKFNPLREVLAGKRLVVVDDSIVRGTTTPRVVEMLSKAGAREVHMRITAPPIRHPCFFGIDMASQWELIAGRMTVEEVRCHIGADTLGYLSIERLLQAVGQPRDSFCTACFTGEYPMAVQLQMDKLVFERRPVRPGEKPEPVGVAWTWEEDRH
jgi:amidophosphoribosyltransferase